jgi:hypothetical protein
MSVLQIVLTVESFEDFVGVGLDVDFVENLFDFAFFVNQKSLARHAHVLFVTPGLLAVNAVGLGDRAVSIGEERERQTVFRDESLV